MTVRFLADEDVHGGIIAGLQLREPTIDILNVKTAGLRRTPDPVLLELAGQQGRAVVTHDRNSMLNFFLQRLAAAKPNFGIFVFPQHAPPGEIIESLLFIWAASDAEEWRDQIVYLPLR